MPGLWQAARPLDGMLAEHSHFGLDAESRERKLGMSEPLKSQSPLPVISSTNKTTPTKPFQTVPSKA